ncbi:MAG: MMPL family transporter [Treponema sp.]|nr:MMPL family transporter [Treponema sp.]
MKHLFKFPALIVAFFLAITVFFAMQLRGITVDNDNRIFFPQHHESYQRLLDTEDTFGSTVIIGVVLETPDRNFITDSNIRLLQDITEALENTENIDKVQSLTNIDYLTGENNTLTTHALVDDSYTGSRQDLMTIQDNIADWHDMYDRLIISDDKTATMMMLTLVTGLDAHQKLETLHNIRSVVKEKIAGTHIKDTYVGDPVQSENSSILMGKDLTMLIPLVALIVLICLYFSFHTLEGTILPLICVIMGTCWSVGIMAMTGANFTIISTMLPVALIACGSAYGIHVFNHYYIALNEWKGKHEGERITKAVHKEIILLGLNDVLLPVLLAGVTTIAGFISLITSPLTPLKSFAVFSSLGIGLSLLFSITFIPALMMLKPEKALNLPPKKINDNPIFKRIARHDMSVTLFKYYKFFVGTRPRLVLFILVISILSAIGIHILKVDTALINYFPKDGELRTDVDYVDKRFAGTNSVYLVVSGPEKGSMIRPEILEPLDILQDKLQKEHPEVGKVISLTTFIKRMNQVMHIPASSASYENTAVAVSDDTGSDDFGFDFDTSASESSDDFGFDFSSEDNAEEDFGFDFGDAETAEDNTQAAPVVDFVDPNIAYAQGLEKTATVQEILTFLKHAQAVAGGRRASVQNIVDELYKELNFNGEAYYEVPVDIEKYGAANSDGLKDLVSQYLLLYSGELDQFADNQLEPQKIRVLIQMRERSSILTRQILTEVKQFAAENFPEGYTIEATGTSELEYTMTNMIISGQITSLIFSLLCVFIIITIAFKSPVAGIIGAIPLALTILLNYMIMGIAHISLDMFTSLIASLAVGIGIDYTIHFMTDYRENRHICNDTIETTRMTLKKSGKGIITNALSVGLGFIVLCLSNFVVLKYIGLLVAAVMFTSSMLAMSVIPALLNSIDPKFMRK